MKTLMLSAEDMQSFGKILPHPTTIVNGQSIAGGVGGGVNLLKATPTMQHITLNGGSTQGGAVTNINLPDRNLVTMQYFLKHPTAQNALQQQLQQRQLIVTQSQLKQLTTKHPTSQHQQQQQQQQQNYHTQHHQHHQHQHHHHPYYQQSQQQQQQTSQQHKQQQQQQQQFSTTVPAVLPVHALNQNSNFSAASSSTGGTASSHAPTQQSNTTAASFSPPGATANKRTTPASNNNNNNNSVSSTTNNNTTTNNARLVAANNVGATSNSGGTKKLKNEPVLSQFHQSERLAFANTHISWSEEHWKRVVFHDERKFNLDGPDGFSYYFHDLRNYERTLSQRPRGNSVFIYIVISAGGAIHLDVSTVKQKPESSIETILRERNNINLKLNLADFLVQDHNWTATSLPTAQEWLNAEGVKLQKWPAIAHDLNIMENIWGWLIREVYDCGRKFSRKDDLIFRIKEAWERLPLDLISNLYSTLPERITELYYTRGVYTNC